MDEKKIDAELERRRRQRDRNTQGLVELMARRRELQGVHPLADQFAEAVAWSA